ncbi:MAG: hypothetical protein HY810_08790 [Candidatus Omnitrophica bacterium]|nr:hypothetical protein [Candidatus Omnitrophota bacterium]
MVNQTVLSPSVQIINKEFQDTFKILPLQPEKNKKGISAVLQNIIDSPELLKLVQEGNLTARSYRRGCGLSINLVRNYLSRLVKEGYLIREGYPPEGYKYGFSKMGTQYAERLLAIRLVQRDFQMQMKNLFNGKGGVIQPKPRTICYYCSGRDIKSLMEVIEANPSVGNVVMVDKRKEQMRLLKQELKSVFDRYEQVSRNEFNCYKKNRKIRLKFYLDDFVNIKRSFLPSGSVIYISKLPGKNGSLSYETSFFYAKFISNMAVGDYLYVQDARLPFRKISVALAGLEEVAIPGIQKGKIVLQKHPDEDFAKNQWVEKGWRIYLNTRKYQLTSIYTLMEIDNALYRLYVSTASQPDKLVTNGYYTLPAKKWGNIAFSELDYLLANAGEEITRDVNRIKAGIEISGMVGQAI